MSEIHFGLCHTGCVSHQASPDGFSMNTVSVVVQEDRQERPLVVLFALDAFA